MHIITIAALLTHVTRYILKLCGLVPWLVPLIWFKANVSHNFKTKFVSACSVLDIGIICKFFLIGSWVLIACTTLQNFIAIRQRKPCYFIDLIDMLKYILTSKNMSDPCLDIAEGFGPEFILQECQTNVKQQNQNTQWPELLGFDSLAKHFQNTCLWNARLVHSRSDLIFGQSRLPNIFIFKMLYFSKITWSNLIGSNLQEIYKEPPAHLNPQCSACKS